MIRLLSYAGAVLLSSSSSSIIIDVTAFVPAPMGVRASSSRSSLGATLEGRLIEGEIKPTNNFVLVKIADAIEKTDGGIILAGKSKVQKTEGVVIAVGPGKVHQESGLPYPMPVAVGEGVVYGQYDGTEVEYNGDKHTLIRDDDVLVKYTSPDTGLTIDSVGVCSDSVLVKVESKEDQQSTSGGLLLAQTSTKKKPSTGTVVRVGPGRMASNGVVMAMDINVGDMVKFRDFAGNEVDIQNEEYSVVRMPDILAKF